MILLVDSYIANFPFEKMDIFNKESIDDLSVESFKDQIEQSRHTFKIRQLVIRIPSIFIANIFQSEYQQVKQPLKGLVVINPDDNLSSLSKSFRDFVFKNKHLL